MTWKKTIMAALLLIAAIAIAACQPQEPPPQAKDGAAECLTDANCATAGCSGQLCVKAEDAEGIITTCEYREEYECLKLTSCGCNEGKCGWKGKETAEYAKCIESTTNK